MKIQFSKMHGLGNDFMVIDMINQKIDITPALIQQLADRHCGVGFDQMLCIHPSRKPNTDLFYRIFNADGSEAEQCGNGARCIAKFVIDKGLLNKKEIIAETSSGDVQLFMEKDGQVRVNMGAPILEPDRIPFKATHATPTYSLRIFESAVTIAAVSMGNPHAVLQVDDLDNAPVSEWGPLIEKHERFPNGTNVGFMQIIDSDHIGLRVFERGTGETLACGSGACAAMVAARLQNLVSDRVTVQLPGGNLTIQWSGNNQPVWMTGPAVTVYDAELTELD